MILIASRAFPSCRYFVTFIMGFYMMTYFGVMGDPWKKPVDFL